jgi:hypothetical protein
MGETCGKKQPGGAGAMSVTQDDIELEALKHLQGILQTGELPIVNVEPVRIPGGESGRGIQVTMKRKGRETAYPIYVFPDIPKNPELLAIPVLDGPLQDRGIPIYALLIREKVVPSTKATKVFGPDLLLKFGHERVPFLSWITDTNRHASQQLTLLKSLVKAIPTDSGNEQTPDGISRAEALALLFHVARQSNTSRLSGERELLVDLLSIVLRNRPDLMDCPLLENGSMPSQEWPQHYVRAWKMLEGRLKNGRLFLGHMVWEGMAECRHHWMITADEQSEDILTRTLALVGADRLSLEFRAARDKEDYGDLIKALESGRSSQIIEMEIFAPDAWHRMNEWLESAFGTNVPAEVAKRRARKALEHDKPELDPGPML